MRELEWDGEDPRVGNVGFVRMGGRMFVGGWRLMGMMGMGAIKVCIFIYSMFELESFFSLMMIEYVALPLRELIRIPSTSHAAKDLAPLLCAGATALGGVRSTNLNAGEWLCVVGAAGGVGGLAVKYGKHFGHRVVAIDSREKEKRCVDLGADVFVDYEDGERVVERVMDATKEGVNGTVVCSASPVSYSLVFHNMCVMSSL